MYTVKILSNKEFDLLPFKHTKTSLGLADPKTNVAYIRDTGYNDITKATIAHELDELVAKVSPHEEDGIRYKNLAGALGSFGNAAKSIAQPVASGVGAFGRFLGSGVKKAGSFFSGGGGNNALSAFGGATAPYEIPDLSGVGGATGKILSGTGGGGPGNFFGGALKNIFGAGVPNSEKNLLQQIAPGAAISLAGNLFAPKVEAPDFSAIKSNLMNQFNVGTPEGALGKEQLRQILTANPNLPPTEAFRLGDLNSNEQLQQELLGLRNQVKSIRPGADVENDPFLLKQEQLLRERYGERRTAARDELTAQYAQQQQAQRMQAIQTALNLDQAQMSQLSSLAQLDVAEIMYRTGLTAEEASQIKQLFGNIGNTVIAGNMGLFGGGVNGY